MSNGRFILGLGSGVERLNQEWHNARWGKPVAHIRETVAIVRQIIAQSHLGERMTFEGEFDRIDIRGFTRPFTPARSNIPIYLGGMGPVMTKLAGEIGDGWISHELCSPKYLGEMLGPWLTEGREKSGRDSDKLDIVVSAACAIDKDAKQAKRWAAGLIGFYATVKTYADFFEFHGMLDQQNAVIEKFRTGVSSDDLGDVVPDEMVDALTLAAPLPHAVVGGHFRLTPWFGGNQKKIWHIGTLVQTYVGVVLLNGNALTDVNHLSPIYNLEISLRRLAPSCAVW
jgi:alkanesulfonate monooxygenase SsuD/methylene tetrahydromethanopterin reductase-like flavin-dependent oxidoreductase (luciferase family)